MTTLLITIHIISCFTLILVVLLQAGRGADMGAAFGGASTPMFGSGSASNPLTRITTITAIAFMTTALFLAVSSARRASVFDSTPEPLAATPQAESAATPPAMPVSPQAEPPPFGDAQPLTIPATPSGSAKLNEAPPAASPPAAAPSAAPAPSATPPAAAVPAPAGENAPAATPPGAQ